jgi:pentose-5-phosphate-3-epimerase
LGAGEGAGSASLEVVASCLSCDIQRLAYEIKSGGLFAFHGGVDVFHMDSADHNFCFFSGL